MKLTFKYLNHKCKFTLNDKSEVIGIVHYFFHGKFPNRLFLLKTEDMQTLNGTLVIKPLHNNYDNLSDQQRSKYFRPIQESDIRAAVLLQ